MEATRRSKPTLEIWNALPESLQAMYRGVNSEIRCHSGRKLAVPGRSRQRPSGRSMGAEELNSLRYFCDEPDTATQLTPFIGKMDIIDLSAHVPLHKTRYHLYVGDLASANDQTLLRKNNIRAVLSFGETNDPTHFPSVTSGYLRLAIRDSPDEEFFRHFDEIYRFLSTTISEGNVLVHCYRGRNRSAAAAVYFVMKHYNLSLSASKEAVSNSRGGFMKLSRRFENQLQQAELRLNRFR